MSLEKRRITRTKVWPETLAIVDYGSVRLRCQVDNISAKGVFIISENSLPKNTKVILMIDFDPEFENHTVFSVKGYVLRCTEKGIAIKFTEADPRCLGDCIMNRLNKNMAS
jgi:hypothetical protein